MVAILVSRWCLLCDVSHNNGFFTQNSFALLMMMMMMMKRMSRSTWSLETLSLFMAAAYQVLANNSLPTTTTVVDVNLLEGDMLMVPRQLAQTYGPAYVKDLVAQGLLLLDEKNNQDLLHALVADLATPNPFSPWPRTLFREDHDDSSTTTTATMQQQQQQRALVISYQLDPASFQNDQEKEMIDQALQDLSVQTGVVSFVEQAQPPYLRFVRQGLHRKSNEDDMRDPCWSYVGYQLDDNILDDGSGNHYQDINMGLTVACMFPAYVQHLVLHALGLWHENSRWDRDDFIQIQWAHVAAGYDYYFAKRVALDTLGLPYDYASLMHCPETAFSKNNNQTTMVGPHPLNNGEGPSRLDVIRVRLLYQCQSGPRSFVEYQKALCTVDCPCWLDAQGCGSNHYACQAGLVCESNTCVLAPLKSSSLFANIPVLHHGLWIFLLLGSIGFVLVVVSGRHCRCHYHGWRDNMQYQPVP